MRMNGLSRDDRRETDPHRRAVEGDVDPGGKGEVLEGEDADADVWEGEGVARVDPAVGHRDRRPAERAQQVLESVDEGEGTEEA